MRRRVAWIGGLLLIVALLGAGGVYLLLARPIKGDPALKQFVHHRPPVPVVFTSRTQTASFRPAADEGEGFVYPGQAQWQAREGRLRLLTPEGEVVELTWGRPLPDGGTLIDVMSPSLSPDGKTIAFAGRRSDDHGRFRLYEIGVNGRGLRQLTGGPDDSGCVEIPPMRFRSAGDSAVMADAERRSIDYDDVDPMLMHDGTVIFASSRMPDLGRGHSRRATNLWMTRGNSPSPKKMTSNRNNERWPYQLASGFVAFSFWSRNTEVIAADGRDIVPYEAGVPSLGKPTDTWFAAVIHLEASRFGALVKPDRPVWRGRPLFNGRMAFMTDPRYPSCNSGEPASYGVFQAEYGSLHSAPSSGAAYAPLPAAGDYRLYRPGERDGDGRMWSWATPSPCPGGRVLLSGAIRESSEKSPVAGTYGLYLSGDDWPADGAAGGERFEATLLFDDPALVDAEPVAVYERDVYASKAPDEAMAQGSGKIALEGGGYHEGAIGYLACAGIYTNTNDDAPGQTTDIGQRPVFLSPPQSSIREFRFYASRRDRFDDPTEPRVRGKWELLFRKPMTPPNEEFDVRVPAGVPFVIAAFDKDGKVARWSTEAEDAQGRRATFYAFAGDHYSAAKVGRYDFCNGCHSGHSNPGARPELHRERLP